MYRLTPDTTMGRSPAELMLGRQSRSRLDLRTQAKHYREG